MMCLRFQLRSRQIRFGLLMEMPNCRYLQISLDLIGLGPSTRLFSLLLDFNGHSLSQSVSQLVFWYTPWLESGI